MEFMTIGQLAKKAEVNVETVRYYERRGLIPQPKRPMSGRRQYSESFVTQIQFIKRAQNLGFSLKEISELLSFQTDPNTRCKDIKEQAQTKIVDIENKIHQLQAMKKALIRLNSLCKEEDATTNKCPIIESLCDQKEK